MAHFPALWRLAYCNNRSLYRIDLFRKCQLSLKYSKYTPHSTLSWVSYGVSGVSNLQKTIGSRRGALLLVTSISPFKSLGPSDIIWHWRSWSTLFQVIACCLMAPCHYLNQCWLIISKVLWHSSEDIIIKRFEDRSSKIEDYIFKISLRSPRGQWVKP